MPIRNKKYDTRLFILVFVVLNVLTSCVGVNTTTPLMTTYSIETSNDMESNQLLHSVYAIESNSQPTIVAVSDLICLLGDIAYPPEQKIICIDETTGTTIWEKHTGTPSGILTESGEIYITYGSRPGVEKYDLMGNFIWSRSLNGSNVVYAYLDSKNIQLFLHPENYVVLSRDNGETIFEQPGEEKIFSKDDYSYILDSGINAKSDDLDFLYWTYKLPNELRLIPLFTERHIFLRTERNYGAVICLDRLTGEVRWETESFIISNIAYSQDTGTLYVLSKNTQLLSINSETGELAVIANFSPLFPSDSERWKPSQVAFNNKTQKLIVYLGFSKQLFTIDISID